MKEYKVIIPKGGLLKRNEKIEDQLNRYAREGWELKHVDQNMIRFILERDKNR